MDLKELEQGIFEALLKGQMAAPPKDTTCPNCGMTLLEDKDEWASWIQEIGIFIYELAIRFKQRGLKFDDAKRKAWWAMHRRVKEETVARIMNIRLPHEPEGLYTVRREEVCECGKFKSVNYPQCPECAEKRYKEINDAAPAPAQAPPQKEQSDPARAEPDGKPSS